MSSKEKVTALVRLGQYLAGNDPELEAAKEKASQANGWFTPEFINLSIQNICRYYLDESKLTAWLAAYPIKTGEQHPRIVGIVAAGNIPLVCFHDWLCGFLSGHQVRIKLSEVVNAGVKKPGDPVSTDVNLYTPWLDTLWDTFGENRVLYGSDWPHSENLEVDSYPSVIKIARAYLSGKSRAAQEKVFWKNSIPAYRWIRRDPAQPQL